MGDNFEEMEKDTGREDVIGFDALYRSMWKCKRGVSWKDSVAAFTLRGVEKTESLSRDLHAGTYKAAPPKHFRITHPKPRSIASVAFRDRVYQRSLNDNVVYPTMVRGFIFDNYACQKGKGTDPARERLKEFMRSYFRNSGASGWVAQFDIRGYYPNMSHEVAEGVFARRLDAWSLEAVKRILREQYPTERGYDPGSQLVQIAGISVLDGMDHFIKEKLRARYYIRYMDDFLILSPDKEYLSRCRDEVEKYVVRMDFKLNPDKTRIYPLEKGVRFLGFDFRLTETGRVLMTIDPKSVKAVRRKLRRMAKKFRRGEISREKVDESYQSWRTHAAKGNSFHLLQRMDQYYKNLWRE